MSRFKCRYAHESIVMPRRYRLKARAQRQEYNRTRSVEATDQLHMAIGPTRATTSAIARLAGVKRPTVQRHFPDLPTLFMACSLHGMQLDTPPDPAAWQRIADPGRRLLTALCELYPFYRRNRTVWADMLNFLGVTRLDALVAAAARPTAVHLAGLAPAW